MKNWRTLILSLMFTASTASFAAPQQLDKVAAVVNNGVVLESDVNNMLQTVTMNARNAGQQIPDQATLRQQILERLIMDNIVMQMAGQMQITIPDQAVDGAIEDIARQNNMTTAQMKERLQRDGMSYDKYRSDIRKEMMMAEVRNNEVRRRVVILPQEVESLANLISTQNAADTELNISHILIPLPENPTEAQMNTAKEKVTTIMNELQRGADFGKLAITYSADPQALKGGNMGWSRLQELPGLFAERLQSAKSGEIVGPVRSGVGFHILRVNEVRGNNQPISVTEVKARHILIKPSPIVTDEQARGKLQQIASDVKSGKTTFDAAAKQFSEDPGSALRGGELGWSMPDIYDLAFRDALMKLKKAN